MATIQAIGKAQAAGLLLEQLTGVKPSYKYFDDYVRIYYQPDRLLQMQRAVEDLTIKKPGEVRFDWFPVVQPVAIKKAIPYIVGLLAAGYLIGKL